MMKRPTEKDTKKVIMDYVAEVEDQLKIAKEGKFNPEAVRKEEHKKEVSVKAEAIVEKGILNQEILDEFKGLKEDIENKKADLKTLYGIDAKAETLAALIESNNIELTTFRAAKDELIAEKQAELDALEAQYDEKEEALQKSYEAKKTEVNLNYKRDLANANYGLERNKKIANDAWADEKRDREAKLAAQEAAVIARENTVTDAEAEIQTLKTEVESLPQKIIIATKKAQDDAEKKMNSILEEKKTALEKEVELDKKLLNQELAQVKATLAKTEEALAVSASKLDDAYKQINDLSIKTVQASQVINNNSK